jgi:hypothetical protein
LHACVNHSIAARGRANQERCLQSPLEWVSLGGEKVTIVDYRKVATTTLLRNAWPDAHRSTRISLSLTSEAFDHGQPVAVCLLYYAWVDQRSSANSCDGNCAV